MVVESLADLVEPYRRAARERRRALHTVYAVAVASAMRLPNDLPPSLSHRAEAFHDTIEAIEGEGWGLEHVSALASGYVLLVFRAVEG
ncbi:hypothetical protein ACFC0C_21890 [Streptomyces sp. NPDC056178]|uniref:hypothetical protein n=1 Tax=unclassified Streptomyces TaxID=2593676 RepID=UPI0035E25DD2